jgi:hypothetical protein
VVRQEEPVRLRCFRPPAITRVSRLLRAEALPVFFDVNTFVAEVMTPLHWDRWSDSARYLHKDDIRFQNIGTLRISADDIKLFKTAGKVTARIRNIDFVMSNVDKPMKQFPTHPFPALVCMKAQEYSSSATTSLHIRNGVSKELEEDLRYLTAPVKKFLDDKIANPNFKGFSITELQRLANTVRVAPRPDRPLLPLKPTKKNMDKLVAALAHEEDDG